MTTSDPTQCDYVPPGEYMKDHSIVELDGWYHLFNISGTAGYYHGYNGNEETISWSVSKNLVDWEFRGHVLHASGWDGFFDQHEIWAPFCFKGPDAFYMYYTGIVHPTRPMSYNKQGHDHPWVYEGHKETQGIAKSSDLTDWVKISDQRLGSGVPGRDSHVVYDEEQQLYLLYSTMGTLEVHLATSKNLEQWENIGQCAEFPELPSDTPGLPFTAQRMPGMLHSAESLYVMRHPLSGRWIMMGNWQYILSDNPGQFKAEDAQMYDLDFEGQITDMGFTGEMIQHEGRWYRSGTVGERDYWRLTFTEVEWVKDGAFKIVRPSCVNA